MKKLEKPQFDMETIIDNCLVHMQCFYNILKASLSA